MTLSLLNPSLPRPFPNHLFYEQLVRRGGALKLLDLMRQTQEGFYEDDLIGRLAIQIGVSG